MTIEDFNGYHSRQLNMPDGGKIICFYYRNNTPNVSLDDANRNVFRVDRDGRVLWQITRIDHPETRWDVKHQQARERGLPGCVEPFVGFRLRLPDGTTNMDSGMPPDEMDWIPGYPVELANLGIGSQWYLLDVETGVAVEITRKGVRPW